MKNSIVTTCVLCALSAFFTVTACNKKQEDIKPSYNDKLLVVKNDDVNKLIRKYDRFEKDYVQAFRKNDLALLKFYSDSTNLYDKKLFEKETAGKMDAKEKVLFNQQINDIRKTKMEAMASVSQSKDTATSK